MEKRATVRQLKGAVLVCILTLTACPEAGSIDIDVVIPIDLVEEGIDVHRTEIIANNETNGKERTFSRGGLSPMRIADLSDGRWTFTINGFDRNDHILLQGRSLPIDIFMGVSTSIKIFLAPIDQIFVVPESPEQLSQRCGLTATLIESTGSPPAVLIAGGEVDGVPSQDTWLYHMDQGAFSLASPMNYPRAHHTAAQVSLEDGHPQILIVGGGAPLEIYDPKAKEFEMMGDEIDFSEAVVAALSGGKALIATLDEAWILSLHDDSFERIRSFNPLVGGDGLLHAYDHIKAITVATENSEVIVVLGGYGDKSVLQTFTNTRLCSEIELLGDASKSVLVPLSFNRFLLLLENQWWEYQLAACSIVLDPIPFVGTLDPTRNNPVVQTMPSRNALLITGGLNSGEERGATSIFFPSAELDDTSPTFEEGPISQHLGSEHTMVWLPDETMMIVGCNAPVEIYNPLLPQ